MLNHIYLIYLVYLRPSIANTVLSFYKYFNMIHGNAHQTTGDHTGMRFEYKGVMNPMVLNVLQLSSLSNGRTYAIIANR